MNQIPSGHCLKQQGHLQKEARLRGSWALFFLQLKSSSAQKRTLGSPPPPSLKARAALVTAVRAAQALSLSPYWDLHFTCS